MEKFYIVCWYLWDGTNIKSSGVLGIYNSIEQAEEEKKAMLSMAYPNSQDDTLYVTVAEIISNTANPRIVKENIEVSNIIL